MKGHYTITVISPIQREIGGIGNKDLIGLSVSGSNANKMLPVWAQSVLGTSGAFVQYTPNKGLQTYKQHSDGYFWGTLLNGSLQPVLSNSRYGNNFSSNFIFGTSQMYINVYDDGKDFSK